MNIKMCIKVPQSGKIEILGVRGQIIDSRSKQKYLDRMQRIKIKAQPRLKSEKPYPREYLVKLRESPGDVRCCLQENISNSRAKNKTSGQLEKTFA